MRTGRMTTLIVLLVVIALAMLLIWIAGGQKAIFTEPSSLLLAACAST